MDGLQLQRDREAALRFARGVTDLVASRADASELCVLGSTVMDVRYESGSEMCRFAAGSFIPAAGEPGAHLQLAQLPFGELALPLEWCRPWIPTNSIVPARVTHPYRIFLDSYLGFIHVYDSRTRTTSVLMRSDRELDGRTLVAPFRTSLNWLAQGTGAAIVHAAAVTVFGAGVLIAGPSGSGKSTASMALAHAGHGILGDDSVVVMATGAYALYRRAKLASSSPVSDAWPAGASETVPLAHASKTVVRLDKAGVDLRHHTPIDLVLFPRVARRLAVQAMPANEAIRLIAVDAAREVRESSSRDIRTIASSLATARCARVNVPAGVSASAHHVQEAIERSMGNGPVAESA